MRHHEDHDLAFTADEKNGNPLDAHTVHYMRTVEDSKKINDVKLRPSSFPRAAWPPEGACCITLRGSRRTARTCILLAGFQAEGTRGRALEEGAKTVRIHGEDVPVCAEVINLRQFSAHAGQSEFMRWLTGLPAPPRQTYLTHGEPQASAALKVKIESAFRWRVALPQYLQTVDLNV